MTCSDGGRWRVGRPGSSPAMCSLPGAAPWPKILGFSSKAKYPAKGPLGMTLHSPQPQQSQNSRSSAHEVTHCCRNFDKCLRLGLDIKTGDKYQVSYTGFIKITASLAWQRALWDCLCRFILLERVPASKYSATKQGGRWKGGGWPINPV